MMNQQAPFHSVADHRSPDYNACPKLHPDAADPHRSHPPPAAGATTTMPANSNPYVSSTPSGNSSSKNAMDSVRDVLGKWGKKAAEATKKAESLAGNMWQHLKTSPNVADAAVARISHGTKVLAEGGYEKVFRQTFQTTPEEQLQKTYACYLSTSVGPIMGTLYLSTSKLAFCSDNPLSYQAGEKMEWSYYKVIIQLTQVKAVNPSTNKMNPAEKYIQIVTVDKHEFWFMAFVNYDSAVKNLKGLPQMHSYNNNYVYMEVEPHVKEREKMVERRNTAGNVEARYANLFKLYVGKLRPAGLENRKRRLRSISPETPSSHAPGVVH